MSTVLAQWGTIMLLLGLATAAQWGTISIHGGVIIGRKQGRSMQIFAYPSRSPTDVNVVDNTLFWTTVEVQFANGTIKSVAPLHGLSGVIAKAGHFVGIGDLTGKGGVHPAGLVMTVTFSGNTVMDEVHILYSSPVTHIVHYNKEIAAMPAPQLFTVQEEGKACDVACGSRTSGGGTGSGPCSTLDGAMTYCYENSGGPWSNTYVGGCVNKNGQVISSTKFEEDGGCVCGTNEYKESCEEKFPDSYSYWYPNCTQIQVTFTGCQEACHLRSGCEAFSYSKARNKCKLQGQQLAVTGVDPGGPVVGGDGNKNFMCYTRPKVAATTMATATTAATVAATTTTGATTTTATTTTAAKGDVTTPATATTAATTAATVATTTTATTTAKVAATTTATATTAATVATTTTAAATTAAKGVVTTTATTMAAATTAATVAATTDASDSDAKEAADIAAHIGITLGAVALAVVYTMI